MVADLNTVDIVDLLETRAVLAPHDTAYCFLGADGHVAENWTYLELCSRVHVWSQSIARLTDVGDRVVLSFSPGLDFVSAFYGALHCGVVAVPTAPPGKRSYERFARIIENCKPRVIVASDNTVNRIRESTRSIPIISQAGIDDRKSSGERRRAALAFLQYTSGSTSNPKGVMVTHSNILHNQRAIKECFEHDDSSRVLGWLPVYHDMGLIGTIMQPLFIGRPCYMMSPVHFVRDPLSWLEAISRHKITTSGGPNFAYDLCADRSRGSARVADLDLSCWRVAFNGSEPIRRSTLDRFTRAFSPAGFDRRAFLPCYGLAEATLIVAGRRAALQARESGAGAKVPLLWASGEAILGVDEQHVSCGLPAADTLIQILDPVTLERAEDGSVGEIVVSSPSVAAGYFDEVSSQETFLSPGIAGSKRALRTGDLGILMEGQLYVVGRSKDVIVLNGRKIHSTDLENAVEIVSPEMRNKVAAFGVVTNGRELLSIAIESGPICEEEAERVANAIRDEVWERHEVGADHVSFLARGALPRTTSGKIQRRKLKADLLSGEVNPLYTSTIRSQAVETAPVANPEIAGDVAEIIRLIRPTLRGPLSGESTIATLGFDSLALIELNHRLERRFGTALRLDDLHDCRTVAEVAERITVAAAPEHVLQDQEDVLSSFQCRFLALEQLNLEDGESAVAASLLIEGTLDRKLLRRCILALTQHHRNLWLTIDFGSPCGDPRWEKPTTVEIDDLESHRLSDAATDYARKPFFSRSRLFRFGLIENDQTAATLIVCFHHIVADGWSMKIFLRHLISSYQAGLNLDAARTDRIAPYSRLIRRLCGVSAAESASQLRTLVGSAPHLLPLPFDAGAESKSSVSLKLPVSDDLIGKVFKQASAMEVSPAAVWMSAFGVVLSRWSGLEEFLVGSPIINREEAAELDTVGLYLNVLPVRISLKNDPTIHSLILSVANSLRATFAKRNCDLDAAIDDLRPIRSPGRRPLLQVLFNYLGNARVSGETTDFKWTMDPILDLGAKFDVTVYVIDSPHRGGLVLTSAAGRLSQQMVAEMGRRICEVASALSEDYGGVRRLSDLRDSREALQLSNCWPGSVTDRIRLHAQRAESSSRSALDDGVEEMDYSTLDQIANGIAARLKSMGVGQGDNVAIIATRSSALPIAIAGCMRRGAVYSVIDSSYPLGRIEYMLDLLKPTAILGGGVDVAARSSTCASWNVPTLADRGALADLRQVQAFDVSLAAADPACVTFTSGSTGNPLAVVGCQSGLTAFLPWICDAHSISENDRFSMLSGLSHDPLQRDLFSAWWAGGTLCVPPSNILEEPQLLRSWLIESRVTVANFTPATARMLSFDESPSIRIERLRLTYFVGEALTQVDVRRFRDSAPYVRIISLYGTTETQRSLAAYEIPYDVEPPHVVPIGSPPPGVELMIISPEGQPADIGETGEIGIRSHHLALGYLSAPERQQSSFIRMRDGSRMYRTGDLGWRDASGEVHLKGRIDREISLRGFRIGLEEIEAIALTCDGVSGARAKWFASEELLCLFVCGREIGGLDRVKNTLSQRLPQHMVPSRFVELDRLPVTPNGKTDDHALKLPSVCAADVVAPLTSSEAILAAIWSKVLNRDVVERSSSFIALGGHSLRALELQSLIRTGLGVEFSLAEILGPTTLAEAALRLAESELLKAVEQDILPDEAKKMPNDEASFGMTDIQQAYWIGRSNIFGEGAVGSHSYYEFDVHDVDVDRLEFAWNLLCERHPMLRTVFTSDGRQRTLTEVPPYKVHRIEVEGFTADEGVNLVRSVREKYEHEIFDASQWPLFRVIAVSSRDKRTRLIFGIDFLIADAWSWGILGPELYATYRDPTTVLRPLRTTFQSCVQQSIARQKSAKYSRSLDYWKARVRTLPPAPQLPGYDVAPTTSRHARLTDIVDQESWRGIVSVAAKRGLTPASVVLAVYGLAIAKWSKEPSFTLNLTTFDRDPAHPDMTAIVGDFTSSLLVSLDTAPSRTFDEFAKSVKSQLLESMEHAIVSGVRVLREATAFQGGTSGPVTMPIVLTSKLGLSTPHVREVQHWLGSPVHSSSTTPQVAIDAQISEDISGVRIDWDINDAIVRPDVSRAMFSAFVGSLRSLRETGSWDLVDLIQLPAADKGLFRSVNSTQHLSETGLLHSRLQSVCAGAADRVALVDSSSEKSFEALGREAFTLSGLLHRYGVRPGEPIPILIGKSSNQIVSALGILMAGGTFVPIDMRQGSSRIARILDQLSARILVRDNNLPGDSEFLSGRVCLTLDPRAQERHERLDEVLKPATANQASSETDPAYIIFTSGSTGVPKGVVIDHRGALNTCLDLNARFGVTHSDTVFAISSFSFDLSIYDIFGVLGAGGRMILPADDEAANPARWWQLLHEHQVTIWNSTPSLMQMLVQYCEDARKALPASLRLVLLSGDWIPGPLPERIRKVGAVHATIACMGGATEASIWSILHVADRRGYSYIPYGKPLLNQKLHILDHQRRERPVHAVGEIYIGGIGLAKGYFGNDAETSRRFVEHPELGRLYRTGDLGSWLPEGEIRFLGREDSQVKINGFRVELGEIENVFRALPDVREAAVLVERHTLGNRLAAFVCLNANSGADGASIARDVSSNLPNYMVPSEIRFMDSLPLTPNGKVDRTSLLGMLPQTKATGVQLGPRTTTERIVHRIFEEVLECKVDDASIGLFRLGGTSMQVPRIQALLKEANGIEVSLAEVLQHSSVESLTRLIESRRNDPDQKGAEEPGEARAAARAKAMSRRPVRRPVPDPFES